MRRLDETVIVWIVAPRAIAYENFGDSNRHFLRFSADISSRITLMFGS